MYKFWRNLVKKNAAKMLPTMLPIFGHQRLTCLVLQSIILTGVQFIYFCVLLCICHRQVVFQHSPDIFFFSIFFNDLCQILNCNKRNVNLHRSVTDLYGYKFTSSVTKGWGTWSEHWCISLMAHANIYECTIALI